MLRGHSGAFTLAGFLLTLAGTAFAQNTGTAELAHADGILNVGIVRYIRPSPHEAVIEPTIAAKSPLWCGQRRNRDSHNG